MRKYIFTCIILTVIPFSAVLFAQDITGLWKGTLFNDTTGVYHRYEIAISEKKGKLTGYSHTWFIVDDKQYYGVKQVKIKKIDGKILVTDDELIANNYPVSPAKNVRQLNVLELDASGPVMTLQGPFSTNQTKTYRSLTGYIQLERKNDFWQSALVPHLRELGKAESLSFVQAATEKLAASETAIAKNEKPAQPSIATEPTEEKPAIATPIEPKTKPDAQDKKEQAAIQKAEMKTQAEQKKAEAALVKQQASIAQAEKLEQEKLAIEKARKAAIEAEKLKQAIVTAPDTAAAAGVNERITETQQTVVFVSDSLELTLYDNGEVDGDTVSVLLNGEIILAKQRLSTRAIKKTIYIPAQTKQVTLVMYAESLGSIPPNTGLLVIRDGKQLYEVRFSGDLKKNAGIIFNRKEE